jgi:hypothetical protein
MKQLDRQFNLQNTFNAEQPDLVLLGLPAG